MKTENILEIINTALTRAKLGGELSRNAKSVTITAGPDRFIVRVKLRKAKKSAGKAKANGKASKAKTVKVKAKKAAKAPAAAKLAAVA